jgi:hypothetical protein
LGKEDNNDDRENIKRGTGAPRRFSMNLKEAGKSKDLSFIQPKIHPCFFKGHNIWLIKPNDCNRGRGIKLFNDWLTFLSHLKELAQSLYTNKINKKLSGGQKLFSQEIPNKWEAKELAKAEMRGKNCIIQKYMEDPMLINGRKFDIRVWVLLDFEMNVWFFR